jgi:hypothetical protein
VVIAAYICSSGLAITSSSQPITFDGRGNKFTVFNLKWNIFAIMHQHDDQCQNSYTGMDV